MTDAAELVKLAERREAIALIIYRHVFAWNDGKLDGAIEAADAILAAQQDAGEARREDRENIAKTIAYDLELDSAHGARVSHTPHLDNYHIEGHVNLYALADAILRTLEQG